MSWYLRHFTAVGDEKTEPGTWEQLEEDSEEVSPSPGQPPPRPGFREALQQLYCSTRFQVVVVCLVVLDAIFVMGEVLIDLAIIKLEEHHVLPEVFHYLSLALLTFFMIELVGKLYAYRLEFFQHKFEVFDGVVVMVSFVLDIVFVAREDVLDGVGFLILLRLWRVARIINGILVSLKTRADHRLHKLKESYDHLVQRSTELQERSDKMEQENNRLCALLRQNGIEFEF
ncbi:voltage-gated hydrogen channel 1 [Gadus chalcogrammus]|uniref:voltage-gated hydrogen channel 1 n=1 Tax=Gadus chalcogrammus TaxID=1042646 RepID=UPI0024C4B75F|nr:voltage-gated hydrogen channel 1 [Gadus chalcogrammus]XP_056461932.1 voltage-gated hydrogen channel 1 [Gadus chalcogrammus]XP_056461933.1 voltage-gated hydrogen channel 1 [Gadus chalcogrammus]XP_056461934.1 voltage-gated hydrogen channel 1 [Gadus chalcogrammus]